MLNRRLIFVFAASLAIAPGATSAQTQASPSCTSSIRVFFNRYGMTHIPAGSTIWFTAVLKSVRTAGGRLPQKPLRIEVHGSRITFGSWPYVITMPDSAVDIDPSVTVPLRLWESDSRLHFAYAPAETTTEALFDALPYAAPADFVPQQSGPATWTATFTASQKDVTLEWAWSAAVYTQFGRIGSFQLKPLSGPIAQVNPQAGPPDLYVNADSAGTPEAYKQYVVAGAMGRGAPQYTGARSDVATVTPCATSATPAPVLPPPEAPWVTVSAPQQTVHVFVGGRFQLPQRVMFADGSGVQAVNRCYSFDLCAQIFYSDGSRLAVYAVDATSCHPYVLDFIRWFGEGALFSVKRRAERGPPRKTGCVQSRPMSITLDGGHATLSISQNADDSLTIRLVTSAQAALPLQRRSTALDRRDRGARD